MAMVYRKIPVEIHAQRWDGTVEVATEIVNWILGADGTARYHAEGDGPSTARPPSIHIDTPEGTMRATPGDWVVQGVEGEFYPVKDSIFRATYEVVAH